VVRNSLYHGETWDASLHPTEWNSPLFDDQDWTLARILDPQPSVRMVARQCAPIRCTQEIQPVSMHESEQGSFIFDFGQNMAGVVRLRAKGQKGTRIQLRFSELLHPDGSLNTENLRSARATDVFILAGTGETEEWAPMFTYHGFRYVEVSGYPGTPERDALVGLVLHTDAAGIGGFTCSSRTMTGIQQNIEWGLRSNMHSVPTDCPQRDERLGWTGDAQVIAPTACWNRDVLRFFSKWLRDLRLTQTPEGWVRDVAPAAVVEGPAAPGWGDAIAIVPWEVFRYTGDRRILIDNFEAIRNWVEYMRWKADGLLYKREGYGDWVAPEASPKERPGFCPRSPRFWAKPTMFGNTRSFQRRLPRHTTKPIWTVRRAGTRGRRRRGRFFLSRLAYARKTSAVR
jgi:alpha-L-rhamnosidase